MARRVIDWPQFLALATHHHVLPLVFRALKAAAEREEPVPAEFLSCLRHQAAAIAAHNLRAAGILRRLQALLEAQGIRMAPIKGPVLAVLAYGGLSLRQFEDLDIVVRRVDSLRAVELLEREGYVACEIPADARRDRYAASLQDWSLRKPGAALHLDLKPTLISHTLCGASSADFIVDECGLVPLGEGHQIRAPGPAAMLLAVCMDGANEAWAKLSSVADVGALLAKHPSAGWAKLLEDAARLGNRRSVLVGAQVAEILLGCSLPDVFKIAAGRDPASRRLAMEAAGRMRRGDSLRTGSRRRIGFAASSRDGWRGRGRFWGRLLFVPGAADLQQIALPDALYPLYSCLRPFRLAWDALRGRPRRLGMAETGSNGP